jgi:predicted transglutaminase-like cysteine proteinase
VLALSSASEPEKLKHINDFFNRKIKNFDDDINIWGQSDYWATPLESLGRQSGDCEDYSIAKYIFLRQLGIADERLKLTYVRAQIGGPHSHIFQAHMVLSYYASANAQPLILDNLISDIRPASRRLDLTPIFSFNSAGLWVGATNAPKGDATSHLSRWRDVLARVRADGIE